MIRTQRILALRFKAIVRFVNIGEVQKPIIISILLSGRCRMFVV